MGLALYTIVASQMEAPAKLRGDRFINVHLLAQEQDYDLIVAQRVRELSDENKSDILHYYEYYRQEFKFMKNISREYFTLIFPFQPRCFEIIRKITSRELPTARIGIGVIYDCVRLLTASSRSGLIIVHDLMKSEELTDALDTTSYRDGYTAFRDGLKSLEDFGLEDEETMIANKVLTTLFLWYIAYLETPRLLSVYELTEATLTSGDVIKGEDQVEVVLSKLRDLPHISYKKDRGAQFVVTKETEIKPQRIFSDYKRKITDETAIYDAWERGLLLEPQHSGGEESLFAGYALDERKRTTVEFRKIDYPGEVIVTGGGRSEYGEKIIDSIHFRIVFLTSTLAILGYT